MNIWIINHYAVPPEQSGGIRHHSLAKELIARGHQVQIIAANFNHYTMKSEIVQDCPQQILQHQHDGVNYTWIRVPSYQRNSIARLWNMLMFGVRCFHYRKQLAPFKPAIVIGSSPHLFAALSACWIAKCKKVPFVFEIRDLWPESLILLGKISRYHPLMQLFSLIESYLYRHAALLVTVLPNVHDYLISKHVDLAKLIWLPNFFTLIQYPESERSSVDDRFTVIYAGSFNLANSIDTILEAAVLLQQEAYADQIKFVFIGDGPLRAEMMQTIQEKKLMNVELKPAVAKNKIYAEISAANCGLMLFRDLPLYQFGINPNKLFDYMGLAKPVILATTVAFNPVAQAQSGIIIPCNQPHALVQAIKKLMQMPKSQREQLGQRGHDYLLAHHHVTDLCAKLEDALVRCCAQRKS